MVEPDVDHQRPLCPRSAPRPLRPLAAITLALLTLLSAACATTSDRPAGPGGPPPKTATRGAEILVVSGGRSHFFENRRPHCLAYALDDEWEFANQQAALRTPDRRRFAGVVLQGAEVLPGPAGSDLVTRAIAQIFADTEKEWGSPVQARVEAFPSLRPGAVVIEFESILITPELAARMTAPVRPVVGQRLKLPLRVVAPFDASLVMVVTVLELDDARAIAGSLEVTEDPQCWRRTIRERFPGVLQ
jgi:hypothetical protein